MRDVKKRQTDVHTFTHISCAILFLVGSDITICLFSFLEPVEMVFLIEFGIIISRHYLILDYRPGRCTYTSFCFLLSHRKRRLTEWFFYLFQTIRRQNNVVIKNRHNKTTTSFVFHCDL